MELIGILVVIGVLFIRTMLELHSLVAKSNR